MAEEFDAFVFPVLALIVGLILDEVNKLISFLGIPDSVLQFLIGMCGSIAINKFLPATVAIDFRDRYSWTSLDPETILKVMLPPLLFEASFRINTHMFFAKLYLIVSLTTVVYFETLFIASALMLPVLVQTQKFKISAVFIFVAIIVATDPVAVVAILEQYGAPHRLKILIEGESLLNDGLALTTYSTLVSVIEMELGVTDHVNIAEQVFVLFMNVVISPFMGIIAAKIVSWIVSRLRENKKRQAFILVSVYGIFMLCDKCSGSPALGLCTFGIMLSSHRETIAPETSEVALELWATMGYWANNVIFIFAGFCVGSEMFPKTIYHQMGSVGYLEVDIEDMMTFIEGILLTPIPLFARIASVYIFYKYYGIISKQPLPPRTDFTILAYSGLRGALGLILAMELHNKIAVAMTKKILLLTCSTTFACLVFQGMTFSSLATKEGSTKRSKYVRDMCVRLCRFLDVKIREALHVMRLNRSRYLVGTNWHVVKMQITSCLKKHETQMENDMMQQQDDTTIEDINSEETKDKAHSGDVVDARIGYYGILLARVHDSWARGAINGCTAHIVISILEHGMDEGQITADDIEHYLCSVDFNCFERIMFVISEALFLWICHDTWLSRFAAIGNCPLVSLTKSNDIHYVTSRPFEKWWIFLTGIMCFYCVFLAYVNFDDASDITRAVIYIFLMVIWIMNVVETLYIFHTDRHGNKATSNESVHKSKKRRRSRFYERLNVRKTLPAILTCLMITIAYALSIFILNNGYCIRGSSFDCAQCRYMRLSTFVLVVICTLYKLTRTTPLLVIMMREQSVEMKLMRARIRLAVFYYLHHLMTETKISRDLFSEAAYKTARKEGRSLNMLVDGLMRLELKENASEIDVVPVIKTRQAMRMMSYQFESILNSLKSEGFMPDDAKEKWGEVVAELRDGADRILWIPNLSFKDWLECVKWIRPLRESSRHKVVDLLNKALCCTEPRKFECGTRITTDGRSMWFLKKGVCRVTEWHPLHTCHHRHYDFHVVQGEFIAERNILKHGWNGTRMPLMWPKRRYETTTYCEMVEVGSETIEELVKAEPAVYTVISNDVQAERLIIELRHARVKEENIFTNFWTAFQSRGKSLTKPEHLTVPEGRVGIVGCWTQVTLVAPRTALDSCLHVKGPADLWVEPVDPRAPGMVFFEKQRIDEAAECSAHDNSTISFVHYGPTRKLRRVSGE